MESSEHVVSPNQTCTEDLPPLFKNMTCKTVAGFDNAEDDGSLNNQSLSSSTPNPGPYPLLGHGTETAGFQNQSDSVTVTSHHSPMQPNGHHHARSISISLPSSPSQLNLEGAKRVMFNDEASTDGKSSLSLKPPVGAQQTTQKFYSQPIRVANLQSKLTPEGKAHDSINSQQIYWRNDGQRDKRFDSFKTWSGKLERQLSNLRGIPQEPESSPSNSQNTEIEALPVDRYFDALEGPELDTLRASEIPLLPEDKQWPFLLRFPVNSFGICLGVSSQAILWKTLATTPSTSFLHVNLTVNLVLWCISVLLLSAVGFIYILKVVFYFEAVKREYYHPVRVNFFFAPWISCLFLALGVPPLVAVNLHASLWYALMAPILFLEIKIYGQWMSGGQRRLSKVANPSNHLSIVGNFVGALLGASMGLKEGPIFFFAVGLAHYTVLFVTLYQRLPTNETLPKELHPVFFLFVAAPSVACMAWAKIRGDFDYVSRIAYFIALFLYASLAVRINFFRGFRFSLAWWAYTFPMTGASVATIRYALEVKNPLTQVLSVALSAIAIITVTALLASTIFHAFVLGDLFPNDISIAISERKQKPSKKQKQKNHHRLRSVSSDANDVEAPASANALRQQLSV